MRRSSKLGVPSGRFPKACIPGRPLIHRYAPASPIERIVNDSNNPWILGFRAVSLSTDAACNRILNRAFFGSGEGHAPVPELAINLMSVTSGIDPLLAGSRWPPFPAPEIGLSREAIVLDSPLRSVTVPWSRVRVRGRTRYVVSPRTGVSSHFAMTARPEDRVGRLHPASGEGAPDPFRHPRCRGDTPDRGRTPFANGPQERHFGTSAGTPGAGFRSKVEGGAPGPRR